MKYLKNIVLKNKKLVSTYIISGILIAFLNSYSAGYYQKLIDTFNDNTLTVRIIIIYGMVSIILYLLSYIDEYPGRKLEHGIFLELKLLSLKKISRIDYLEHQTLGTGKLIQRVEAGSEAGRSILFNYYFCLIRELIPSVIFSIIFIAQISKTIMYAILSGYIIVFVITNLLLKVLYRMKERILVNEEKINHYLVRGFMEFVTFRVNRRFPTEIKKAIMAKEEIVNTKTKMTLIHEAFFAIFALLVTFINLGIISYAWFTKSITIGSVIALLALMNNAYTPIAIFNVLYVQYKLDRAPFSRFQIFLDAPEDNRLEQGENIEVLQGAIIFEQVGFSYKNRKIFHNINLEIKQGEKLALVGESGSGKSTFVKLLLGLLKPDNGCITIGDYELSKIRLNSYYKHISYISQDSPIFDGTLRENLVFDNEANDKEIIEVLQKVQLLDLYKKLKSGLDTAVGEKGVALSGGERQRLALARLWFQESEIIVLDEATSAIDNLTEEIVMKQVLNFLKDRTVIFIAHRLNSMKDFDKIVVFKEGDIVQEGAFQEVNQRNSYFRELYKVD